VVARCPPLRPRTVSAVAEAVLEQLMVADAGWKGALEVV